MPDKTILHLRSLPSVEALDRFFAAAKECAVAQWNQLVIQTSVKSVEFNSSNINLENNEAIKAFRQQLETRPFLDIISIAMWQNGGLRLDYNSTDFIAATVSFEITAQSLPQQELFTRSLKVIDTLQKHFTFLPRAILIAAALPEPQREAIRSYERNISELTETVQALGRIAAEQVKDYQRILTEKLADLEKNYEQKRHGLEQEYQKRQQSIDDRELAFKKDQEAFDLKARMVARRDLSKRLQQLLESKEITISERSEKKRWAVHVTSWIAMLFFGAMTAILVYHIASSDHADWHSAWPLSLVTIGFGSTLVFYLRFIYQWFAELAGSEFTTRKQLNDFVRANWVAELYLESKENANIDIPPELLASFTRNLFVEFDWKHRVQHPIETALDAVTKAKSIEVSPQGGIKVKQ